MLETAEVQPQELREVINVPADMRMGALRDIAAKAPKTLVFTGARNGLLIRNDSHCFGKTVYVRLGLYDVISSGKILEEFERADSGILVVPYAFNAGWRARNINSIVFLDLKLNRSSMDFRLAAGRAWYPGEFPFLRTPDQYFINCYLA